jgi:plastocyanin
MKRTIPTAAACAAFAIAGCGGSDDNSSSDTGRVTSNTDTTQGPTTTPKTGNSQAGGSGGGSQNLQLAADPSGQLKFDKSSLDAKAGSVTITMDNPSPVAHAVAVEGNGVDKDGETVNMGGKSSVTVNLKPGKYTFYCPVDGHEDAGMKGTLTVK